MCGRPPEGSRSPPSQPSISREASQPSISPTLRSAVSRAAFSGRLAIPTLGPLGSREASQPSISPTLRSAVSRAAFSGRLAIPTLGPLGSGEVSQLTKPQRTDLPPERSFPQIRPNETWAAILRVIFAQVREWVLAWPLRCLLRPVSSRLRSSLLPRPFDLAL